MRRRSAVFVVLSCLYAACGAKLNGTTSSPDREISQEEAISKCADCLDDFPDPVSVATEEEVEVRNSSLQFIPGRADFLFLSTQQLFYSRASCFLREALPGEGAIAER